MSLNSLVDPLSIVFAFVDLNVNIIIPLCFSSLTVYASKRSFSSIDIVMDCSLSSFYLFNSLHFLVLFICYSFHCCGILGCVLGGCFIYDSALLSIVTYCCCDISLLLCHMLCLVPTLCYIPHSFSQYFYYTYLLIHEF